jgi:hypothetical protein
MKPTQMTEALQALIPTKRPIYIWGPPGVGKSSLVHQACANLDLDVIDLRAVLLDPVDLRGLPSVHDGVAVWNPPDFLPLLNGRRYAGRKGVIFADELAQAAPLVQSSFLQGVLDHKIGEALLDPNWTWIAASNRQEDRAGTHRVITPLLNRFLHLDLEVSNDDWNAWAVGAGIAPEVRAFMNFKPGLLFAFEPNVNARAFPTPRSWSFVSDVLPATPPELHHPVFAGCVGEGPAAEFVAFLQVYQSLPDVDQVLANPTTAQVPKEPSVLYALSGAIVEKCRTADNAKLGRAAKYTARMSDEFSVLTVRDIGAALESAGKGQAARFLSLPEIGVWLKSHRHLLLQQGSLA